MKKSLTILSLSAGLLVGLTACQSTDDYPGGFEEAMPMSEMAVADGELPPWLTEDNEDSEQIPAGAYTDYAFPDDDIKVADSGSPVSQNQPELAQDDTVVDSDNSPMPTPEGATVLPKPISESIHGPGIPDTPVAVNTPKPKTQTKPGRSTADIKKLTASERKKIKKVQEPTVVTYRVRPGDNLSLIAKRSNTTVAQIRKDSNIKGDTIYPGQIIKVKYYPKGSKAAYKEKIAKSTTHTVKRGESVSRIAAQYGVTTGALLKANNLTLKQASRIQPGRKLIIPDKNTATGAATTTRSHTVSKGESISGIAKKYGVTTNALLKANNLTLKQASLIRPGQELTIPAKSTKKRR